VLETFQPDVLFSSFSFAAIAAAFGSEVHFSRTQAPNVRRPAVQSPAEWDTLAWPRPDSNPHLLYLIESIERVASEHRSDALVAAPLVPPFDLPALVMGIEGWLRLILTDRPRAQALLEAGIPFFVEMANSCFNAGAACVVVPCGFMSPSVVTRGIAEQFSRPALDVALPQVRGPIVLHHVGAPMLAYLDLFVGLPSVLALALDDKDDLDRARAVVGPEPTLFGGIAAPQLADLTLAEVENRCRALLENRRQDKRFILYTCGADIPWETPPENIHALRRVAESCA